MNGPHGESLLAHVRARLSAGQGVDHGVDADDIAAEFDVDPDVADTAFAMLSFGVLGRRPSLDG